MVKSESLITPRFKHRFMLGIPLGIIYIANQTTADWSLNSLRTSYSLSSEMLPAQVASKACSNVRTSI